jgi:hypothetical protein
MNTRWSSLVALAFLVGCSGSSSGATGVDAAASAAASPAIPELVAGTSIGPVRVGMTRAELDALGMPAKAGLLPNEVIVGPYVASFDGDRVGSVFVALRALPAGVRVGGTVFQAAGATDTAIAAKLSACAPVQHNEGADVIVCDGGRAQVIAGGPTRVLSLMVRSAERAAPRGAAGEAVWKHPGMDMSFTYPADWMKASLKPDGATVKSEVLGKIEDRSGNGADQPAAFTITISVRVGGLFDVMKSNPAVPVKTLFPAGTEASFAPDPGFADRLTVAGSNGYRIQMGSHDAHQDLVYAQLSPRWTLEVTCSYLGDMAKPKVPMAVQKKACERVLSTLSIKV